MSDKSKLEGPAEENQQFKPDGAEKLPTKHYPSSTKMATEGKKNTIEGPCNEGGSERGYHK